MIFRNSETVRSMAILFTVLATVGPSLSGCVAVNAAAAVSRATIGTVNAVGTGVTRAVTNTSMAVSRSVQQIPAAMMYRTVPRQVVIPLRSTRSYASRPTRSAVSTQRPRTVSTISKASSKKKKQSKERGEILEVLPPELLDQLSDDQLILQSIVQTDALDGPGEETVFWELDGRAGTALAEEMHQMGGFTCRDIVETIKLAETDTEATQSRATACRTEATSWTLSF